MFLPRLAPRFDVALVDVRSARPEFRLEAVRVLARAEDDASRSLARLAVRPLLDDPVARVRAGAVESLGYVGDDDDIPALARRVREPSTEIRQAAVIAIARIGTSDAKATLRGLLESTVADVRYQAVDGLGILGDAIAADAIAELFEDADPYVRDSAIGAIADLGAAAHANGIAARLGDDVEAVRKSAAIALAGIGDARAIPELRAALRAGRPSVEVFDAVIALRSAEAAPELHALLRRRFARRLASLAAASLASFGDSLGIEHLRKQLRSFFIAPRLEALALIARHRLVGLAPDVAELAHSPRGLPRDVLAHTLERLDTVAEARDALAFLDRGAASTQ